jgi:hypothetical protein
MRDPRPLPAAPRHDTRPTAAGSLVVCPSPALLLLVQHKLQHIVRELRELETHGAELGLGVVAQAEGARGPERSHGLADRRVVWVGLLVHVARVRQLAARRRGCAVDLAVGERAQLGEPQALRECVDAGVDEEAQAVVVGLWLTRVFFEWRVARGRCLLREVFACVQVLDDRAHGIDVAVGVRDLAGLCGRALVGC